MRDARNRMTYLFGGRGAGNGLSEEILDLNSSTLQTFINA